MIIRKLLGAVTLLIIPLTGCTEESPRQPPNLSDSFTSPSGLYTELRERGEIFSMKRNNSGTIVASYSFNSAPSSEQLADRIIWILQKVAASEEFIQQISPRLPNNRRLGQDEFSLPLTDMDGNVYRFTYHSDVENRFYTINYNLE